MTQSSHFAPVRLTNFVKVENGGGSKDGKKKKH
jgi:hypothetical protein